MTPAPGSTGSRPKQTGRGTVSRQKRGLPIGENEHTPRQRLEPHSRDSAANRANKRGGAQQVCRYLSAAKVSSCYRSGLHFRCNPLRCFTMSSVEEPLGHSQRYTRAPIPLHYLSSSPRVKNFRSLIAPVTITPCAYHSRFIHCILHDARKE